MFLESYLIYSQSSRHSDRHTRLSELLPRVKKYGQQSGHWRPKVHPSQHNCKWAKGTVLCHLSAHCQLASSELDAEHCIRHFTYIDYKITSNCTRYCPTLLVKSWCSEMLNNLPSITRVWLRFVGLQNILFCILPQIVILFWWKTCKRKSDTWLRMVIKVNYLSCLS